MSSIRLTIPHTAEPNFSLVGILERLFPDQPTHGQKIALILHGAGGHKDYLFHKRLALRLPHSFRFDFRGCHESSGTWTQGGLEDDVKDIELVAQYLADEYGYEVDLVVGHSRGSISGMRWACSSNIGRRVSAFVNVSGRYRMNKIFGEFTCLEVSFSNRKASETQLYKTGKHEIEKQGYIVWRPTVARQVLSIKLYEQDFQRFAMFDTSRVWDQFPQSTDVLTIHGLTDAVVPPYDAVIYSQALSKRWPGTHSLAFVEDADHNYTGRQDQVVDLILGWWDAHARRELSTGIWTGTGDLRGKL